MKLAEIKARLEEIKQRGYENENFCSCGNHVPFLLTHLEASLAREEELLKALVAFLNRLSVNLAGEGLDHLIDGPDGIEQALTEFRERVKGEKV